MIYTLPTETLDFMINTLLDNATLKKIWPEFSSIVLKKFKILFCAQYFLTEEETSIPKSKLFSKNKKYEICIKNLPSNFDFDVLYSELI